MWLEVYNYVTTKRKFITKYENRFFRTNLSIRSLLSISRSHKFYKNEKINFLLILKSPYIAIKL